MSGMSAQTLDRAPNKEERRLCWDARDRFWECMDKSGEEFDRCKAWRDKYESACPAQWVKHFDRKYVYNQYKKKIETEGFEPIPDTRKLREPSKPEPPLTAASGPPPTKSS